MLIDISDVISSENKERTLEVPIGLTSFDSKLGSFPLIRKSPLKLAVVNQENRRLLLCGEVVVCAQIPCSRCLKEVEYELRIPIRKELEIEASEVRGEEPEDTGYLEGQSLDTDRLVYREILMNWPGKVLCREDCRGICRVCGADLNEGECGCQRKEPDPRMASIQDIFNQFKEV